MMDRIKSLWAACRAQYEVLSAEQRSELPITLVHLLTRWLDAVVHKAQEEAGASVGGPELAR